jgi:preprotein translocase subunit SecA
MGAIADAMVAYAQPLLDETDGSMEDMNRALTLSQLCWNLALLPEQQRETMLGEMRPKLKMDDDEFNDFRQSVVRSMIRRHQEMFPQLHYQRLRADGLYGDFSLGVHTMPELAAEPAARTEKYPGTERYAPCPCGSGRKYKFCCGAKGR